jgi:phosphonoacetaldehyde hydrolase
MVVIQPQLPLKAVLLDWAGTTVDYGSRAPTEVFIEIFRRREIAITAAEAREPMGRAKRDHIATIVAMPRVNQLWQQRYGQAPTDAGIDAMYHDFLPLQKDTLARMGADVIPGVPEAIAELRSMGLKIGSSTGYTRALMDVVAPRAAAGGYAPDVILCADDVPAGRPAPWLNSLACQKLDVYPPASIVIVDDTRVGIEAGLNAGMITVAVTQTGNRMGLSEAEVMQLPVNERQQRLEEIAAEFRQIGAHFVIPSVAELPALVRRLSAR